MNEIGRRTFFWYRVYCAIFAVFYLALTVLGIVLAIFRRDTQRHTSEEFLIMGILYAVVGGVLFALYTVALLLPPKPYNWIVGFIMMAIPMTGIVCIPVMIPLLIYWIKPETRHFFGRR